jgi:outer membrane receptor protein involved in Fe transport
MKRLVTLLSFILFFSPAIALCQESGYGAVSGTVTDPTGAVVPKAQVTVTETQTGVQHKVITNEQGLFSVPSLPPGNYSVSIQAQGFKTYVEKFPLLADQAHSITAQLQLGEATQNVTVEATGAQVNTVSPVLSQVLEQQRVVSLPLNGRNTADLALQVPGVVATSGFAVGQGTTKNVPDTEAFSVNGLRPDQVSYNLDGADNQDLLSNTNDPFPFPDATQEFSVQTSNFSAQYGQNSGAIINVVSKSGTNHWHGDGFEFVRNKVFDARNFFATPLKGSTDSRSPLKRNQFGGTIGGPIKKDKSFIFFGYQHTVIRSTVAGQTAVIPTAANLVGNFSNYLTTGPANPLGKVVQLVDPVTGANITNNDLTTDPNTPLNSVALNMSKVLCPNCPETANGTVSFLPNYGQSSNEFDVRYDQTVRGQDRFTARAYIDRFNALPAYNGKDLLSLQSNFSGDGSTVQTQNYMVSYVWTKSANFVNTSYLSYLRTASNRYQGLPGSSQLSGLGVQIYQLPVAQGGYHGFGASGYFGLGSFTGGAFYRNGVDARDNASWVHGRHITTFGGDLEYDQSNIRNTDRLNGDWNFDASDFLGNALANFLTGNLYSFTQTSGNYSDSRQWIPGLYIQDQWQLSPRLTLDGGLRWDPQTPMKEIRGRIEQFFPGAFAAGAHSSVIPAAPPGLMFIGDSFNGTTVPATGENGAYGNFAPRLGFAYDPVGNGKTVVRGGFGAFYYTRLPGLFLNDATIVTPFSNSITLFPPTPAFQGGGLTNPLVNEPQFVANFPERYTLATVPKNIEFPAPLTVYGLQPGTSWKTPVTYGWNLTVQRQLTPSSLLTLSYVGNAAAHLRQDQDLNPAQYIPANTAFDALSTDQRRVYSGCSPTVVTKCSPIFSDIIMNSNSGNSHYNALQASLTIRPGRGLPSVLHNLTMQANYTFSKALLEVAQTGSSGITDVGSSKGSGMSYYDPQQFAFNRGPAPYNRTHVFTFSYVLPLPSFSGASSSLVRQTLGNWQWSGLFTAESGDSMTILAGTDVSHSGLGADRVNVVSPAAHGTSAQANSTPCSTAVEFCVPFLNTSLFALPAIGQFGNIGPGTITGPGGWNYDMALEKSFIPWGAHENLRFQVRGEFFNALNHPWFNDPNLSYVGSNFGRITSQSNSERIIQLAMKVFF